MGKRPNCKHALVFPIYEPKFVRVLNYFFACTTQKFRGAKFCTWKLDGKIERLLQCIKTCFCASQANQILRAPLKPTIWGNFICGFATNFTLSVFVQVLTFLVKLTCGTFIDREDTNSDVSFWIWGRIGGAFGTLWRRIGHALGTLWGCFGDSLGTQWDAWGAFGHIWDAFWPVLTFSLTYFFSFFDRLFGYFHTFFDHLHFWQFLSLSK